MQKHPNLLVGHPTYCSGVHAPLPFNVCHPRKPLVRPLCHRGTLFTRLFLLRWIFHLFQLIVDFTHVPIQAAPSWHSCVMRQRWGQAVPFAALLHKDRRVHLRLGLALSLPEHISGTTLFSLIRTLRCLRFCLISWYESYRKEWKMIQDRFMHLRWENKNGLCSLVSCKATNSPQFMNPVLP